MSDRLMTVNEICEIDIVPEGIPNLCIDVLIRSLCLALVHLQAIIRSRTEDKPVGV
jgi:hypothetical protein